MQQDAKVKPHLKLPYICSFIVALGTKTAILCRPLVVHAIEICNKLLYNVWVSQSCQPRLVVTHHLWNGSVEAEEPKS